MRNLRLRSAAPAGNVETAPTPTVNVLRGLVARATTPLTYPYETGESPTRAVAG
jgi:hypothetical protein